MSDDHLLLDDILDTHSIKAKELALKIGIAAVTMHKYLQGRCHIPSIVWRTVYKMTGDTRIPKLITGDVPQVIVPLNDIGDITIDADRLDSLAAMRQAQIGFESYVLDIITSGITGRQKTEAIEKLKSKFPEMIEIQTQIFQAITRSLDFVKTHKEKS